MSKILEIAEKDLDQFLSENQYREVDRVEVADLVKENLIKSICNEDLKEFKERVAALTKVVVVGQEGKRFAYLEKSTNSETSREIELIVKSCHAGELTVEETIEKLQKHVTL